MRLRIGDLVFVFVVSHLCIGLGLLSIDLVATGDASGDVVSGLLGIAAGFGAPASLIAVCLVDRDRVDVQKGVSGTEAENTPKAG